MSFAGEEGARLGTGTFSDDFMSMLARACRGCFKERSEGGSLGPVSGLGREVGSYHSGPTCSALVEPSL